MTDTESNALFLSHHSKSTRMLVEELARILEGVFHVPCWYAERDIRGSQNYTQAIPEALENKCRALLLLFNEEANASEQVLREVQMALVLKLPILIIRLDDSVPSAAFKYISSTIQIVELTDKNLEMTAQLSAEEVNRWLGGGEEQYQEDFTYKRGENSLHFFGDEGERERLVKQHDFVYRFAKDAYDKILSVPQNGSFLDVGCNTGEQSKMFLEDHPNITHYIGIDREAAALEKASQTFPDGHFYRVDCERDELDDALSKIERELSLDGFDIINVSMMLLHTKKPQFLIDTLCDHLADGGQLVILDIDDGLNIAYPDPDGIFRKAVDLCFETEFSGFRHSGRQIYELLSEQDFEKIELHRAGLSTVGMSRSEKGYFFDIYFWFILDDLRKMHADKPKNRVIKAQLDWMEEHYKQMRMTFRERGFFFNLGFMLYSATNQ